MKFFARCILFLFSLAAAYSLPAQVEPQAIEGTLSNTTFNGISNAVVRIEFVGKHDAGMLPPPTNTTDDRGHFSFAGVARGNYRITIQLHGNREIFTANLHVTDRTRQLALVLDSANYLLTVAGNKSDAPSSASGEQITKRSQVSDMPLEARDSSTLLLLAPGTTSAAASGGNFTQQYSIHGQAGTTAVFALDGGDTTDPELGGGTITDFNVDAIQRIDTVTGVMSASVGEGAAGYTNVISKTGTNQVHGVFFEFLRNSAFDARNYFDHPTPANPGRIPPFIRNEFGLTNGGPVFIPRLYDGRGRTYYFFAYQGLRQIQGTTQVLSVPSLQERRGLDTTAYAGDVLAVPVDPQIAAILSQYPQPNYPTGPFGPRSYASDSKVSTTNDQFSVRVDHKLSSKSALMGRFTLENIDGPITNPDQTAINPTFAQLFTEGYRSAVLNFVHVPSAEISLQSTVAIIRSTPLYSSRNGVQPGVTFSDSLFEAFNSQAGGYRGTWGNVLQARQTASWVKHHHAMEAGVEFRINRDTSGYSNSTNGSYAFGGGPVYATTHISSASGMHDVYPGQILPDTLSAFLTATPFTFGQSGGGRGFAQGDRVGEGAPRREAYNFYILDNWKITPKLTANYGLRYEVSSRIHDPHELTSEASWRDVSGHPTHYYVAGTTEEWLVNPKPPYGNNWNGWGPRASLTWEPAISGRNATVIRAGAGITTLVTYPFANTNITNDFPFSVTISATAQPTAAIPFHNAVLPFSTPVVYGLNGSPLYTNGSTRIAANTAVDIDRYERDLAATLPGNQIQPLQFQAQALDFKNGYLASWSLGVQQQIGAVSITGTYIGISGVGLPVMLYPNGYAGADPSVARYTEFDNTGEITGGFGPENLFASSAHSSYHGGEFTLRKPATRWGIGLGASYTYRKALDNLISGGGSNTEPVTGARAQNPFNLQGEKGRSSSDVRHSLSYTVSSRLAFNEWLHTARPYRVLTGWEANAIGQWNSGLPFSVYSGVQQTGYGAGGGDRPDQIAPLNLSTHHSVREDYFGKGAANGSYFSVPLNVPGGTGPYQGRIGTLGRDTFTGPRFSTLDLAVWKDTHIVNSVTLEARAEFYNIFNTVNFGLPNNVIAGSGFGLINSTSNNNSRQMQFSLKLSY